MTNTDIEKVLRNEYICKGTLSCPFTPDWLRRCEFEKEQGKKDAYGAVLEWTKHIDLKADTDLVVFNLKIRLEQRIKKLKEVNE